MPVSTYDPKQVILTVGGVPITGFADGTFITVERSNDSFTKSSGADGIVTRVKQNDKSGTITCTLAQTSPSNDILSAQAVLDEQSNAGVVPVQCKDNSGRTVLFSAFAWIRKPPSVEFGKEVSNREWPMDAADLDINVAGNPIAA
jgi:hypothetical protein